MAQQLFPYFADAARSLDPVYEQEEHVHLVNDERVARFGAMALSDRELLALVIGKDGLAGGVLHEAGNLNRLGGFVDADFRRVPGVSRKRALRLAAAIELGRRTIQQSPELAPTLNRPDLVAAYMAPFVAGLDVEKFWVLCLDRKNRLIKRVEVTSGTATATLAHPREVFRAAIRESATAVCVVHNHPSGSCSHSAPDLQITRILRDAAKAVEIDFIDHIIVGQKNADPLGLGYYSFRSAGLL